MKIRLDYAKCIGVGCLDCLDVCPMNVFSVRDGLVVFDDEGCCGCLACVDNCSRGAICLIY